MSRSTNGGFEHDIPTATWVPGLHSGRYRCMCVHGTVRSFYTIQITVWTSQRWSGSSDILKRRKKTTKKQPDSINGVSLSQLPY